MMVDQPPLYAVENEPGTGVDLSDEESHVPWREQVLVDMRRYGTENIVQAIIASHAHTENHGYPTQVLAQLRWHGYAHWAIPHRYPRPPDWLSYLPPNGAWADGVYMRGRVCELNGLEVDGHNWVMLDGEGQICEFCDQTSLL